mmetsp:Transcript_8836/g.23793  ORF Transcript_8836/g.23793 Transcript_8836/m.23793 type:complete len:93 (+) Transcript_8836:1821-2099(+)
MVHQRSCLARWLSSTISMFALHANVSPEVRTHFTVGILALDPVAEQGTDWPAREASRARRRGSLLGASSGLRARDARRGKNVPEQLLYVPAS